MTKVIIERTSTMLDTPPQDKLYRRLQHLWALLHNDDKANLRDLIAATVLVILLKLDSNRRFFSPCDLEIWWMTPAPTPTSQKGHLFYAT